jgi:NAD(P)-dependent dehydrogenase (short-subunit alcohol dehydrogenase family)
VNDALREELEGTGIDVVDVEPGGYRTGIWEGARRELLRRRESAGGRKDLYDRVLRQLPSAQRAMGDPDEVAAVLGEILTMGEPPAHRRIGPGSRWLRVLDSVVPDRIWNSLVSTLAGGRG